MLNLFRVEVATDLAVVFDSPVQLFEPAVGETAHHAPCLASMPGEQPLRSEKAIQSLSKFVHIAIWGFAPLYLLDLLQCRKEGNERSTIARLNQRPPQRECRPNQSLLAAEKHDRFVMRLRKRKETCRKVSTIPVRSFFRWRPQLSDPGDELVLEAAVNGQADAIVTFNESHLREARKFGIAVVRPAEALRRMNK